MGALREGNLGGTFSSSLLSLSSSTTIFTARSEEAGREDGLGCETDEEDAEGETEEEGASADDDEEGKEEDGLGREEGQQPISSSRHSALRFLTTLSSVSS